MEHDPRVPALHSRTRRFNRYVYLVRARRSGGLSLGVNLDPQKTCNFDCVYCEVVDRREMEQKTGRPPIDAEEVAAELTAELRLLRDRPGAEPEPLRDVAFAGDGEPSTFPGFLPLARRLFDVRDAERFRHVPFVLITNGSGLDRAEMREAHDLFAERGGAFWVKLDAGSEAFYRAVCRTSVPFGRVLENLAAAARRHPVVVQAMFFRLRGEPPPRGEIAAWAGRLRDVVHAGGRVSLVQVYTVARETMEPGIAPLAEVELREIAAALSDAAPDLPVAVYG